MVRRSVFGLEGEVRLVDGWACCVEGEEGLRTVESELRVYIRSRDYQRVGYPGCTGGACPWSAGDIAHRGVDVVLMVGI